MPENRSKIEIHRRIEVHYLRQCRHLTAASPGIARAYRERYGVKMTPILNVFPLSQAPAVAAAARPRDCGGRLSVYWFSQTIGPDRGLEPFINAMGKMRGIIVLSIRGSDFFGYSTHLKALAADAGVADASPISFHRRHRMKWLGWPLSTTSVLHRSSELLPITLSVCQTRFLLTFLLVSRSS